MVLGSGPSVLWPFTEEGWVLAHEISQKRFCKNPAAGLSPASQGLGGSLAPALFKMGLHGCWASGLQVARCRPSAFWVVTSCLFCRGL